MTRQQLPDYTFKNEVPLSSLMDLIANKRSRESQIETQEQARRQLLMNTFTDTVDRAASTVQNMVANSRMRQQQEAQKILGGIIQEPEASTIVAQRTQTAPTANVPTPSTVSGYSQSPTMQVANVPESMGQASQQQPITYGDTAMGRTQDKRKLAALLAAYPQEAGKHLAQQFLSKPKIQSQQRVIGADGTVYEVNPESGTSRAVLDPNGQPLKSATPIFGTYKNEATGETGFYDKSKGVPTGLTIGSNSTNLKDKEGNVVKVAYQNPVERKDLLKMNQDLKRETKPLTETLDSVDRLRESVQSNIPASRFDMQVFKARLSGLSRVTQVEIQNETGDPSFIEKLKQKADTFATGKMTKENQKQFLQEVAIVEQAALKSLGERIDDTSSQYIQLHPKNDPDAVRSFYSAGRKNYVSRSPRDTEESTSIHHMSTDDLMKRREELLRNK